MHMLFMPNQIPASAGFHHRKIEASPKYIRMLYENIFGKTHKHADHFGPLRGGPLGVKGGKLFTAYPLIPFGF